LYRRFSKGRGLSVKPVGDNVSRIRVPSEVVDGNDSASGGLLQPELVRLAGRQSTELHHHVGLVIGDPLTAEKVLSGG